MEGENVKLKRFLLENLTEKDAEEIGVRIIADARFAEEMSFAEEDLVEDFLDGTLTADETELFHANFLTTPERLELLEQTALLRKYARQNLPPVSENLTEEKKSEGFFEIFKNFFLLNLRPIAAVLIVAVIGAVAWRVAFYDTDDLTQIEKNYAALNAKDLNNSSETANLSSKNLVAGTFRDTDSAAKLNSTTLTDNVFFRLALPSGTSSGTTLNLELVKNGQTIFRQMNLRVYQNPNGEELKVILPKSVLSKGVYQIKLSNNSTYGFAVE